jgi:hypothetical protein
MWPGFLPRGQGPRSEPVAGGLFRRVQGCVGGTDQIFGRITTRAGSRDAGGDGDPPTGTTALAVTGHGHGSGLLAAAWRSGASASAVSGSSTVNSSPPNRPATS